VRLERVEQPFFGLPNRHALQLISPRPCPSPGVAGPTLMRVKPGSMTLGLFRAVADLSLAAGTGSV
jgi:hypothetical protein